MPYTYVASKARLGRAAGTKRPTSCILVLKERAGSAAPKQDADGVKEASAAFPKAFEKTSAAVKKELNAFLSSL